MDDEEIAVRYAQLRSDFRAAAKMDSGNKKVRNHFDKAIEIESTERLLAKVFRDGGDGIGLGKRVFDGVAVVGILAE